MPVKAITKKRISAVPPFRRGTKRKNVPTDPLKALLYDISESGYSIPAEERARIPHDFAKNMDHYLYGAPKERE
jgi:hypothetical protein